MSREVRSEDEILEEALLHFRHVLNYVTMDIGRPVVSDAIAMRIIAGVEAMSHLPTAERESLVGDDWPAMWGMRNRLAHGYGVADPRIPLATAHQDIPALVAALQERLATLDSQITDDPAG